MYPLQKSAKFESICGLLSLIPIQDLALEVFIEVEDNRSSGILGRHRIWVALGQGQQQFLDAILV